MNVIEKLKKISEKANATVPLINYGGCAVMAAIVGEHLEKKGIQVEGIIPYGNPSKMRPNIKDVEKSSAWDWDEQGAGFGHVALRFKVDGKTYTYDTDRLHKGVRRFGERLQYKSQSKFGEGFTVKELKKIASTGDGFWNSEFNRKHIPKLRKIVKAVLNEQN